MAEIQIIQDGVVIAEYEENWEVIKEDDETKTVRNSRTGKVITYYKKPVWTSE